MFRNRRATCEKCGYTELVKTDAETGDLLDRCPECMRSKLIVLPPKFGCKYKGRGFTKSNTSPRVR